ncbi:hypothetical protein AAVH_13546 [Aphelenchoides avenae]|nr:hypothetical protein AAVH_13546 [Aphelenchus avenae]
MPIWKAKTIAIAIAAVAILSFPCLFFELTAAVEYYYIGPDQMTDYFIDGTVIYNICVFMASISLFISLLSASLDIAGLIAFKGYAREYQISEENRKNLRLLSSQAMFKTVKE